MNEKKKNHLADSLDEFNIYRPRIVVTDKEALIDNVKKIVMISADCITVGHGYGYSSVVGRNFVIKEIVDERMIIKGEIERIDIFKESINHKD